MTGHTGAHRVSGVSVRESGELVTVALADRTTGTIVESITATPEHPFFVEGRGWVELGQVGIGSEIVTRAGPNLVAQSVSRSRHPEGVAVYNFEVEGTHSYFVGDVLGGAWVHNTCVSPSPKFNPGRYAVALGAGPADDVGSAWVRMKGHLIDRYDSGVSNLLPATSRYNLAIPEHAGGFSWLMHNADEIHFNVRGMTEKNYVTLAEMEWILSRPPSERRAIWSKTYIHDF